MQKYSRDMLALLSGVTVPLVGASCSVFNAGTTVLATIYSDNGVTPLANPFTTSSVGTASFYAADGRYDVQVSKSGYTTVTDSDVILEDAQDSLTYTDTGSLASFSGSVNSYVQVTIQNKLNGAAASANYVVANSATTALINYAEFGINSPSFSGAGPFSIPGAAYLDTVSTDLAIGTVGANVLRFGTNNVERASIDALGNFVTNVNTAAPALATNSQMVFSLTSNTNLRISVRGTDGVTRVTNLTLA